ncbi:mycofactocin biosynthesis glycosyltransferase MftF [Nocardia sp. NPDC052254]|uniref:mycofactocin biosynthesis glycosyltransferase MftF n=1 Tax=Nocardia sp. NPDC052254 TaxID=3155681 RepID=UPI0034267747
MTTLRPDARLRLSHDGRVLIGGSPMRMLRLSPAGARKVRAWLAGEPVGAEPSARALAQRILAAGIAHPVTVAGHFTSGDVTVVVPVKDNPAGLARLLAAIGEVRARIVVDDGSARPVPSALRHENARGPAAARNTGSRVVETELIAFLDSDVIPDPGWLDTVLPLFEDPAIAAVAPRVRTLARGPLGRYETHRSSLDMGPDPAVVRPGGRISYVPTAALVIRRQVLTELGGFDETLRYGEDVDLIWRLVAAGHLVRYQPESVVRHEPRATVRDWLSQRYAYGCSAAELARRHPGQLYCARLPWPSALRWLALAVGRPLAALPTLVEPFRRARELRAHGLPLSTAAAVIGDREVSTARQLGDALRRIWWPAALLTRRGRRILVAAYLLVAVDAAVRGRDPRAAPLRIADDLAYGCGVWSASLRSRRAEPLLPQLIWNSGKSDAPG